MGKAVISAKLPLYPKGQDIIMNTSSVLNGSFPTIHQSQSSGATGKGKTSGTNSLGKEDFLSLLVTQLKHQNPLEPMNNQEFIAQLTSFSSLEQLENMSQQLSTSVLLQQSQNNAAAVSLVGKEIKALGSVVEISGSSPSNISYELQNNANVTILIYDGDGNLVKTINAGNQSAGENSFAWDGGDDSGEHLPEGIYTYEVTAVSSDEVSVGVKTFLFGTVKGVRFENGNAFLSVGGEEIGLLDVLGVF
ncbi:MAG: flagellar hook capping protein [Deltaproteobacteria bacterium]|nr:flagellar hook capping protein [Deltaproteobacteria bacterium]